MNSLVREPSLTPACDPPPRGEEAPSWLYVLGWDLAHVGGVNEVVKNLFDRTARRLHHRPLLLMRKWGQKTPVRVFEEGRATITAEIRGPWDPRRPLINLVLYVLGLPWLLRRLLALVRAERVAIIHVHFPDLHALTWLWVRALVPQGQVRVVLSFHGLDLKAALATRGLLRAGWRLLLRQSDHCIVCSQQLQDELLAAFPDCAEHLSVVDNGVDVESVERARRESPGTLVPGPYVMSLGTYEFKKGHDVLMTAFDRIAARNASLVLVIAGRYSEQEYARLMSIRDSLAARERIRLLKDLPHSEAMRLLARAEVFALASREEPFGIVILEAAVLSRPVVATAACGATKLFSAGRDLLVVPAEDVDALSDALQSLLNDRRTAAELARRLRARVSADFDWEHIIERYSKLLCLPEASASVRCGSSPSSL